METEKFRKHRKTVKTRVLVFTSYSILFRRRFQTITEDKSQNQFGYYLSNHIVSSNGLQYNCNNRYSDRSFVPFFPSRNKLDGARSNRTNITRSLRCAKLL